MQCFTDMTERRMSYWYSYTALVEWYAFILNYTIRCLISV